MLPIINNPPKHRTRSMSRGEVLKRRSRSRGEVLKRRSRSVGEVIKHRSRSRSKSRDALSKNIASSDKFPKIETSNRGSRQLVSANNFTKALGWTAEYDLDDLVIIWRKKDKMPLFYRIINTFLLLIRYNALRDKEFFDEEISEIFEAGFDKNRDVIIKQLLENIITLYTTIALFPVASKVKGDEIILYHGIKSLDSTLLQYIYKLEQNQEFELPIFMSTSILSSVACRFTGTTRILLRIRVDKNKLNKFPYIYFDDTVYISKNDSSHESEILLNLFTKLKFIGITTGVKIVFNVPQVQGPLLEKSDYFTIVNMDFVGTSPKTPQVVNSMLLKQIKNTINIFMPSYDKSKHKNLATKSRRSQIHKKTRIGTRKIIDENPN